MSIQSRVASAAFMVALATTASYAQNVISAHSGTLHYFEGDVSIDGTPVQTQAGRFAEVKENGVLRTGQGRAELLLTPGVFLRVGENSSVRLLDNRLASTRVDILSGNAVVESDNPQDNIKEVPVVFLYKNYEVRMAKQGLFELNSDAGLLKVYKGEAVVDPVNSNLDRVTVKDGKQLAFSGALATEKFDDHVGDDLLVWTRDRSQNLSVANMASARSINDSMNKGFATGGYGGPGFGSYGLGGGPWNTTGWFFNPYFNMFTFMPASGVMWNPWGYGFYSPYSIYDYYTPGAYWYGGGGAVGASAGGRPLYGLSSARTTRPAPLGQLLNGNNGGRPSIGGLAAGRTGAVAPVGRETPAFMGAGPAANGGSGASMGGGGVRASAPAASSGGGGGAAASHGGGRR